MKKFIKALSVLILGLLLIFSITGCKSSVGSNDNSNEKNAYEEAVENGYEGTLSDWLKYIINSESYSSIYELAVKEGLFDGTLEEFIESLKGDKGDKGDAGFSSSTDIEDAAAYAVNSIVSIYCNFTATITTRDWWGRTQSYKNDYKSAGSGVIIEDDKENGVAYIVTNYHVIYDVDSDTGISSDISIMLYGMEYETYKIPAKYIGGSMTYDIAVLKIESDLYKNSGAYKVELSNSSNLSVGSKVVAIGNPEANGISVTSGIVSVPSETISIAAADEKTALSMRVIRIDAAVNSGNSGGGLFDSTGKLIGIVNAKTVDEDIEGICYAIPINVAYAIASKIIKTCDGENVTTITKALLGVSVNITSSKSEYNSETHKTSIIQTISVSEVDSNGSAKGILNVNDQIVSIVYNDVTYEITNLYSIEDTMLLLNKDDTITVNYIRSGVEGSASITINNVTSIK